MNQPTEVQKTAFIYLLVLLLVAIIVGGQYLVSIAAINSAQGDGAAFRCSARQEFAVEKLAHDVRQLVESHSPEAADIHRGIVLASAQKMLERHEELLGRSPSDIPKKQSSKAVNAILFEAPDFLDSQVSQFLAQARALTQAPDENQSRRDSSLEAFQKAEAPLLEAQRHLTRQFEVENQEALDEAHERSLVLLISLLLLVLVLGCFLLRPMGRRAQREFDQLTESEGLIRAIVDSSLDAVVMCDSKGTIREWSPQAEVIFGWKKEDVLQRALGGVIVPGRLRSVYEASLARYQATGESRILNKRLEFALLHRTGREFPAELTVATMRRKGEIFFSAFIKDITNQKFVREELKKYQENLEGMLAERTQQLEANYRKLKASERLAAIGELAAKVAHEIKNPLAAIRGGVRLLSRDPSCASAKGGLMDDLVKETRRLDETVNDLLSLARPLIVKKVEVSLGTFLEESAESWRLQREVSKHKIQIDIEGHLSVRLDLRLMSQILNNLVVNASQAMETPGIIKIKAWRERGVLLLSVADTGKGILPASLPSLFTPFFTTKAGGTGLGLAICKKNVEAMDGSISVQSTPGQGATFVVSLPLDEPEGRA